MFSPALEATLRASGWSPERRVSTEAWIADLLKVGFEPIPGAIAIMANFGGLTLKPKRAADEVCRTVSVFFDAEHAGGLAEIDRVSYWEKRLSVRMNPIADLSGGHSALFFCDNGALYSTFDNILYLRGTSFADTLENNLVFGKRVPEKVAVIED
jgi:SUKH-3 immunity protein